MSSFRTSGQSVFDIIVTEHRLVESIYSQIKSKFGNQPSLEGNRELLLLCFTLIREVSIHAHKEHILLYPLFQRLNQVNPPESKPELGDPRKSWDHALEEHLEVEKAAQQIEQFCDQLGKQQTSGSAMQLPQQLLQMVDELMKNVLHHVQDEETRLLPSLKQVAQPQEEIEIGRKWEALTGRVGTRPHPEAPQRGDACLAANNAVADSDKMFDEARFGHSVPSHPGAYTDEMIPQLGLKKEELVQDMFNKHEGLTSTDQIMKPEDENMMQ